MKAYLLSVCLIVTFADSLNGASSKNYHTEDGKGNYNFGYDIEDGVSGSFRRESGNADGVKQGSYGLRLADGRVRVVHYIADALGFRVSITSNEPGIVASSPADVSINGAQIKYSQDTQGASVPRGEAPSFYKIDQNTPVIQQQLAAEKPRRKLRRRVKKIAKRVSNLIE